MKNMNKRKDSNRTSKYKQEAEKLGEDSMSALGKNLYLLVEGDTEVAYFEKLKQNLWLKHSLAGVKVEKTHDFATAQGIEKVNKEANTIWFVTDNDKGNAFILEVKDMPFFTQLTDEQLPQVIREKLYSAYVSDKHNYFLSIHDYLAWVSSAIGVEDAVLFWDRIQHHTPEKKRDFEKFVDDEKRNKTKLKLAYSCIAFEFWLLLHFEQNNTAFLWVDKEKGINVDVMTALKKWREKYEKGYFIWKNGAKTSEEKCHAYNCLYDDFTKEFPTRADDWQVLIKIFRAIKNAEWLRQEMLPILNRQSGKWYEVNPYILGIDSLMMELLNIKPLNQAIDYFDLTIKFNFDCEKVQLTFQIAVNDGNHFQVSHEQQSKFEIRDSLGNIFLPIINEPIDFPNSNQPIVFQYIIPELIATQLVLIFKDPRPRAKSSQLFVLIN